MIMESLQEKGFKDVKEIKKHIKALQERKIQNEKKLDEKIKAFKENFGELLKND